ncbi:hypothetical protein, partial [Enterococcus thailandicus]|uniref:hypothetical protein n=1 Tax=Enterococcus thailandicus TaxID=417368 RepID=UPI0022E86205
IFTVAHHFAWPLASKLPLRCDYFKIVNAYAEITPPHSFYSLQNMKSHFECLLAILSELNVLHHNLIHGAPKVASSVISPLFLKIWEAVSLLLEANHFAPQPHSRCSPSNSSK